MFFIPFCFFLVLGLNPIDVGKLIKGKMGEAVGMSVGVPENEYNKIAAQLEAKEKSLLEKERELKNLELEITRSYKGNEWVIIFLSIGIVVLFILVGLNYYLDYKRRKREYR